MLDLAGGFTCADVDRLLPCVVVGAGVTGAGAGGVGPSSSAALRMTASGAMVVKPGVLVNCAAYHCGGRYHLVSPTALR